MMKKAMRYLAIAALVGTVAQAATVATVNGKAITSDEVNKVLMEGTQGRFSSLPEEKQKELTQRVIDGMISQELVYDDAKKNGVLESETYKKELADIMERIQKQLAAKVWEQNEFDKIKVGEKEVKAYFDKNPDEFVEKEKVHARHILVKTEAKANELIGKLKSKKGDALKTTFIELAKTESTGPSAPKGGDLGFFPQGQMVPAFNDAAFAMKEGTITTTPVKSQFGYHIIYLEEKQPGKKLGFDEVKNFIEQRLKMDAFKAHMEKKMEALKKKAKITFAK
jgi:parvulin-like peptidyl-prolyl isomerase